MGARSRAAGVALAALWLLWSGCAGTTSSTKPTKADRMCARLPACRTYLAAVSERVTELWRSEGARPGQRVVVLMRIDARGNPLEVRAVRSDSPELARTCRSAIAYAAPFGPLPASLVFMTRNEITLELAYRGPGAS
jgi:hypothetical protein